MNSHSPHTSVTIFHPSKALNGHAISLVNKLHEGFFLRVFPSCCLASSFGVLGEIKTVRTEAFPVCLSHKKKIVVKENATTYNVICSSMTGPSFCG